MPKMGDTAAGDTEAISSNLPTSGTKYYLENKLPKPEMYRLILF